LLDHFSKFKLFDRIVLAGASEATSELFRLLPKAMRRKVIASAALSANAPESQIVEEVLFLGRKAERAHELETVEVLIPAAAKANHGVAALPETLAALEQQTCSQPGLCRRRVLPGRCLRGMRRYLPDGPDELRLLRDAGKA
jgi:Bacterial archaeo-eukaryotic release factor family 10